MDGAIRALEQMAASVATDEGRAYALFRAAVLLEARGDAFYPEAIVRLKTVVEEYPEAECAPMAKALVARINRDMIGGLELQ